MEKKRVEIGEGQTWLVIVQGDRVVDCTWAMMPHVEFVKRSVGVLPRMPGWGRYQRWMVRLP